MVDGEKVYYYTYKYDEAGQLVREDILEDNKTITYTYDIGGNITSKKRYAYTLGELAENVRPIETFTYGYTNPEWGDLLTEFNGLPVAYDSMGNVTEYNGITFEWSAGNQLKSSTADNGIRNEYYYNENGFISGIDRYSEDGSKDSSLLYIWDGDRLVGRSFLDENNEELFTVKLIYDTDCIDFIYWNDNNEEVSESIYIE